MCIRDRLEHRQWIETRCRRQLITPFFPLWGMEETDVVRELLRRKARLLIVALRGDLLDEEWIGQELDEQFLQLCLERGLSPVSYTHLDVYKRQVLERVQSQITKGLEHMTGQNILGVNIYVKGLWVQGNGN